MTKHLALIGLLLVAMLTGCSHDESTEAVDSKQTNVSADFVSADEATTIAEAIQFGSTEATTADGKATTRSAGLNKEVQSVTPVPDASGVTAFYVINYKGGGFMLLAADKRVNPVLAYSETSTFPMDNPEGFPEGLVDWMTDVKKHIQTIREKNITRNEDMNIAWELGAIELMTSPTIKTGNQRMSYHNSSNLIAPSYTNQEEVSALTKTEWGQDEGYNDLAPKMGCTGQTNGRALVGCVPVAFAQIMKYYRHPNRYKWSLMKDTEPTREIAMLMRDIGVTIKVKYGCGGTSVNAIAASPIFSSKFGYAPTSNAAYSTDIVINELKARRPVILMGGAKSISNRHAWICDGYRRTKVLNNNGAIIAVWTQLHMNWGMNGFFNETWYAENNWKSNDGDYNFNKMIIYGIKPKK